MTRRKPLVLAGLLAFVIAIPTAPDAQAKSEAPPAGAPEAQPGYVDANSWPPQVRQPTTGEISQVQALLARLQQQFDSGDLDGLRRDVTALLEILDATVGLTHPLRAKLAGNAAYMLYLTGAVDEAASLYESSLTSLKDSPQFHPDVIDLATGYVEVLLSQDVPLTLWRKHPSLEWLLTHTHHAATNGESLRDAYWLEASALIAENKGEFEEAEATRRRVLEIRKKLLPPGDLAVASAESRLGASLADVGRMDEAETLANRALVVFEAQPNAARIGATATAYLSLGKVRALRGQPVEADSLFQRAIQTREKILGTAHGLTIDARLEYARFLRLQGRDGEANALLQPMLDHVVSSHNPGNRMIRVMLESIHTIREPAECHKLYEALEAIREPYMRLPDVGQKQKIGIWEGLGRLNVCTGRLAEAAKDFEAAYQGFFSAQALQNNAEVALASARYALLLAPHSEVKAAADAASVFARHAVSIAGSRRRQGFANSDAPSFGSAVDRAVHTLGGGSPLAIAYEAGLAVAWPAHASGQTWGIVQGFESAQELSVSGAATAMAQTRARTAAGSGPLADVVKQQQELSAQAVALDRQRLAATTAGDNVGAQATQARLDALGKELEAVDARLRIEFPEYANLVSPATVPLKELQARLGPDEGLLLLVPVRDDVHAFAVSRSAANWHRLGGGAKLSAQRVARLRCQVDPATCGKAGAAGDRGVQSVYGTAIAQGGKAFDRDAAWSLYHELIEPVEPALAGVKRLFVTNAGELAQLPLGMLVTRAPLAGEGDADPAVLAASAWFADRYALVTLPAVSALRPVAGPTGTVAAAGGFLGFGAPTLVGNAGDARSAGGAKLFAAADAQGATIANVETIRHLAPLPGTQVELKAMAALFGEGATLSLGNEATEGKLKQASGLANAQVIAFATHGLLPREVRGMDEPGLVFTPPTRGSAIDDGVLTASEASKLSLAAEWIILSACNTAAADGGSGAQSLSGLARSFLYAGAESLLASHWRVSDDATAALTTETLAARRADAVLSRAQALQVAMRAVRTGKRADGSALPGWKPAWAHPSAWAPFVLISDRDR